MKSAQEHENIKTNKILPLTGASHSPEEVANQIKSSKCSTTKSSKKQRENMYKVLWESI